MKSIHITVHNPHGLHARPATVLVNLAKQFKSAISIQKGDKRVNAKSIISVLTLGATSGSAITVQAEGEDEANAIEQIEVAIQNGLGETDSAPTRP